MLRQRLDLDQGPEIRFESVGVNRATVFSGLCAEHDSSLFRVIEHDAPDLDISPDRFARFGAEQRETIRRFFAETILRSAPLFEHEHLNLFDVVTA